MGNQVNKQRNFSQIQAFRDVWVRQRRIFAAIVLKFSGNVDITLVNHLLKFWNDQSWLLLVTKQNLASLEAKFSYLWDVWGCQRRISAAIILKFSGNMDTTLVNQYIQF